MKSLILLAFASLSYFNLAQFEYSFEKAVCDKPFLSLENNNDSINRIIHDFFTSFDIDVNNIDQIELYIRAMEWIGVSYGYGQNTKNGIDCSNFTKILVNGVLKSNITGTSNDIFKQCLTIEKNILKEGDLVFFKINKPYISHVGVYLQNNKFIHATINNGVIISDLNEAYYKKYYFASGRLKN